MSNRVFSPGSKPLEEGPTQLRTPRGAKTSNSRPTFLRLCSSFAQQTASVHLLTHHQARPARAPTLPTYLSTCLLSRQNPYLPALHQSDHHYRPYNQAYRIDQPDRAERKGFETRRHSKYILHDYQYTRRDWH